MSYYPIELFRGSEGRKAPPVIKQAIRFARRLRARNISAVFPIVVDDMIGASILVGSRIAHIDSQGSITPQLKPAPVDGAWRFDRQGYSAWRERSHARYLTWAASDRRLTMYHAGRVYVDCARVDRLYFGGI